MDILDHKFQYLIVKFMDADHKYILIFFRLSKKMM